MDKLKKIPLVKFYEAGICLLVFLLPWQTRLILHHGMINGNPNELLTLSIYGIDILLLFLVAISIFFLHKKFIAAIYPLMAVRVIILFVIFSSVSIFWAENKPIAMQRISWLLLAIILAIILANTRDKMRVTFWFVMGLMLSAWLSIYQFVFQYAFANKWLGLASHNRADGGTSIIELYAKDGSPVRWLRGYGSFDHPNMLGGAMAVGIVLALWILHRGMNREGERVLLLLALGSMTEGLFASLSRSAWAGLFLALVAIIVSDFIKKQKISKGLKRPIVLIWIVFAALVLIYPNQVMMRSGGQGRLEQKSLDDRGLYLRQGVEIIKSDPIIGVGAGNYIEALLQKNPSSDAWTYQGVHDVLLYVWAELGIISLVLLVTGALFLTILAWKKDIFIFAALISLIPSLLLDHWLWDLHFGVLLLGFLIGIILNKREK
jgi:O-antigen ligase